METPQYELGKGPFFHGTKADLSTGDLLSPGYESNYEDRRISNYIYFTATLEAAKWGAELASGNGKERIYMVKPIGEFENDPNLTDKRYPGNPTRSYRSASAIKILAELSSWERHTDEQINTMLADLKKLKEDGLAEIDD
ncbi:NAD(+)--rifampin ADP-ribosyltransferase [Alkalibacterium sp. f15]|uniref:NAD(+)--rifampin ADP-ribosyltransferase n=1 Tax=Alkalibacterium sp. f15 TaxID=3414029 RepID=UPI003BF8E7D1